MTFGRWLEQFRKRMSSSGRRRRSAAIGRQPIELKTSSEILEPRILLAADWGDAPDTSPETSDNDYQTSVFNNGPSHTIDLTLTTLFLGNAVDGDSGVLQSDRSNADDIDGALPDDEDGVLDPLHDLIGTTGSSPTVTLLVTNTSGSTATLAGWIDFNSDGVFDNATERATASVPDNTAAGRFTLTFPTIPNGSSGETYVRFRLSTDAAFVTDPSSIGTVSGGEVEDYTFTISSPSSQAVDSFLKIASDTNGGPTLSDFDYFGLSAVGIGDLDEDGVSDLAVAAFRDDTGGPDRGAVFVLFMNADGSVKSFKKIASKTNGGPSLADSDQFGVSVASIPDLDGDGVVELIVGANLDVTETTVGGAFYVLFMNPDGSVKNTTKVASGTNGGPELTLHNGFGGSATGLGDLDGDGITDIAVAAPARDTGGANTGSVFVLLMNSDGTVKASTEIASNMNGGPEIEANDFFGRSVTGLGDLDGDGIVDLAVGAESDDTGGNRRGAVHVLLLNSDGTVKSSTKIASDLNGGPKLSDNDFFGWSVASIGDLDGDGISDIAVGSKGDKTGGQYIGAVHLLLLHSDGTVKSSRKIADSTNGGPPLDDFAFFGSAVTGIGDLNGDGVNDIAIGARQDNTGGPKRGAFYVHFLEADVETPGQEPQTEVSVVDGNLNVTAVAGGVTNDDWRLAANGTNLTITDNNGNPIDLTGSLDGATGDGTASVTLPLSVFAGGTLNISTLSGDDSVNFGTLILLPDQSVSVDTGPGAGLESVTISGTMPFGPDQSLSVSTDTIELTNSTSDVSTTGVGTVSLNAARNIMLLAGSSISTVDGGITLSANVAGTRPADVARIDAYQSAIQTTGTGHIEIIGMGSESGGTSSDLHGVLLRTGTSVTSTASGSDAGTIRIVGSGSDGRSRNHGVYLYAGGTAITSVDGDIQITGTGGGNASSEHNSGVVAQSIETISSTGVGPNAATITITGTAGNGDSYNYGVDLSGHSTAVTSVDGDIRIAGTGGENGTGHYNYGVGLDDIETISSTGSGPGAATITIDGIGGNGRAANIGVRTTGDTDIISIDGDILITGMGGGNDTGFSNMGILLNSAGTIASRGSGPNSAMITIDGTGGNGAVNNYGVHLYSASDTVADVTSFDGDIQIIGTGGRGNGSDGVFMTRNATVRVTNSDLTVVGRAAFGDSSGVTLIEAGDGRLLSVGSGSITVVGEGSGDGFDFEAGGDAVIGEVTAGGSAATGNITINADSFYWPAKIRVETEGVVTIQPRTVGRAVSLGGMNGSEALELTDKVLGSISASQLNIGNPMAGDIFVDKAVTISGTPILSLETGGALLDRNSSGTDITVPALAIRSVSGIGGPSDRLETAIDNLAFTNSGMGDIQLQNLGSLSVSEVDSISNSTNAGGGIDLSALAAMTVSAGIFSSGDLALTVFDSEFSGEDLIVNPGVTIESIVGSVALTAGDNLELRTGSTVRAMATDQRISIRADVSAEDAGGTSVTLAGILASDSMITVQTEGDADTFNIDLEPGGSGAIEVRSFGGDDTFNVTPGTDNAISIFGGSSPTSGRLNFTTATGETSSLALDASGGTIQTTGGVQDVTFTEVNLIDGGAMDLLISGTDDDDQLIVTGTGGSSAMLHLNTDVDGSGSGASIVQIQVSTVGMLNFDSLDGEDVLQINHPFNGLFSPAGAITYNGGIQAQSSVDSLELLGGTATTVTQSFSNTSDGSVDWDGTLLTYSGLARVMDTISSSDRAFTFGAMDDDVTVSNIGAGTSRIESVSNSATVDFTNPTNSLTVNAGSGHDSIDASGLASLGITANGGDGNDTLTGSTQSDMLNGNAGDDSILGSGGSDKIMGGAGNDVLDGGNESDTLTGNSGNDTLTGGLGDDTLNGGANTDRVVESRDADFDLGDATLTISPAETDALVDIEEADLNGGASANTIDASDFSGTVTLMGGDGNDTITGAQGSSVINGNMGNDNLTGLDADDTIMGGGNDDILNGGGGADMLTGQAGNDTLTGGTGNDTMNGGDNDDLLIWNNGDGSDMMDGGADTDELEVNGSTVTPTGDSISVSANGARFDVTRTDGGAGLGPFSLDVGTIETLDLNTLAGNDNVTINDLTGVADLASIEVDGGDGNDTVDASALPNLGLNVLLEGGNDNDTVTGSAGPSAINGNMGNDSLTGGAADDTIMGGGGDDFMNGGAGGDMLTGQAGNDTMTGDTGDDTLNGGADTDLIVETRDADFDLGDTSLTISPAESDTLMDVEEADLTGGASANTIDASDFSGVATLTGDAGDDTITGAAGASMINGNMGNDSLIGQGAADGIMGGGGNDFIDGGAGNDTLTGQANDDTITGNTGDDNIMGGDGNDLINGSLGNDTISGDAGDDRIQGSNLSDYPGNPQSPIADLSTINQSDQDSLLGGAGSDTIAGAIGADFIDGEADADIIDAQSGRDTTNGIDTIVGDMADFIFRDPEDTVL